MRVVFHDRDDADRAAARLRADGFDADVVRERFAGEDDDEDHPWSVVTDAPEFAAEILAEELDGWVDHEDVPDDGPGIGPPPQGLELPRAPLRVKRPPPH